jgi:hypothetical protein
VEEGDCRLDKIKEAVHGRRGNSMEAIHLFHRVIVETAENLQYSYSKML